MNTIMDDHDETHSADGQNGRDLRVSWDPAKSEVPIGVGDLRERTDSSDRLKALRKDSAEDLERRIELPDRASREFGTSGGSPWFRRITKRVLLLVLLILALAAVSPFVWNYLQSYESTDDAQIDGHIDPLSSRINGTVIRVYAENNDRVKAGELLVEFDPRDYEVAVAQARARLELAVA